MGVGRAALNALFIASACVGCRVGIGGSTAGAEGTAQPAAEDGGCLSCGAGLGCHSNGNSVAVCLCANAHARLQGAAGRGRVDGEWWKAVNSAHAAKLDCTATMDIPLHLPQPAPVGSQTLRGCPGSLGCTPAPELAPPQLQRAPNWPCPSDSAAVRAAHRWRWRWLMTQLGPGHTPG